MLNRWVRYYPLLDLLASPRTETILEVGSGSFGMGEFVPRKFVGCDLMFDGSTRAETMLPVSASGTRLPFRDASFSLVLCLDTMEHVPRNERESFVKELLRVAEKTLILGAPMGKDAAEADRQLHEYFVAHDIPVPSWMKEHIALLDEFPHVEEFLTLFNRAGVTVTLRTGESAWFHRFITVVEHTRFLGKLTVALSWRPWRTLITPILRIANVSSSYRTYFVVEK